MSANTPNPGHPDVQRLAELDQQDQPSVSGYTEPQPPRVSDEDRAAAVRDVSRAIHPAYGQATIRKAEIAVDTLVSHGWGPRQSVTLAKLSERIHNGSHACPHDHEGEEVWVVHPEDVVEIVRECGIEVSDDSTPNPLARPADCDYPGAPSVLDGKCRCLVCDRCKHHTGNSSQGHYWGFCNVTKTNRGHHFCCPGDCELEAVSDD